MTGYIGCAADAAQTIAQDAIDNSIHESRQYFPQSTQSTCIDCGDDIPFARLAALKHYGCIRCIACQQLADKRPRKTIRMLDHVL